MKNIILLTHGDFSKGIAQASRFILGEVKNLTPLSVTLNETIDDIKKMIDDAWHRFGNDLPTVVLTDLPGGSTTQAALSYLAGRKNFFLISGLNLGLLLEIAMLDLTEDEEANRKLLEDSAEASKQHIRLISVPDSDAAEAEDVGDEL